MFALMNRLQTRNDRGAAAVEFALVLPMLLILLVGITQFGLMFTQWLQMEHAAREGVRWGSLGSTVTEITAKVKAAAPGLDWTASTSKITITPSTPSEHQGDPVTVTVTYAVPVLPLMGTVLSGDPAMTSYTLTAKAVQLIE